MISKNIKEIKVQYSCHKDWTKMQGAGKSRHCDSCDKLVFDFSNATNQEVIEFLTKRKNQNTCGKFNDSQLDAINRELQDPKQPNKIKPFLLATTLTTMLACGTSKQVCESHIEHGESKIQIISNVANTDSTTIVISGQIFDESNEPLLGATFILDETSVGCVTDFEGKFKLEYPKHELKAETASVHYVGYETLQIPLIDIKNKEIKIELLDMGVLLGEIAIVKHPIHKRIWYGIKNIFR